MRKKLGVLLILGLMMTLFSCTFFPFPSFFIPATTVTQTLPVPVNGTITIIEDDYATYPAYECAAYDLNDIDAYNDVLLSTRDLIRQSNVQISATMYKTVMVFPGVTQEMVVNSSSGSGVIYKADDLYYYAITNFHVIDDGGNDPVYEIKAFGDETATDAEVISFDETLDLAVIRFAKGTRTDVHLIDYETRLFRRFVQGELVLAVGNPLGLENNVTYGDYQTLTHINSAEYAVIYHTATISNGSSGGALCDVEGHLIGINTWGSTNSDEQSFAIPVTILYMFLVNNDLI